MANKALLLRYAEIKIQIKKLTAEAELLNGQVLEEIAIIKADSDQPVQLSELPGHSFSIASKKTWTYSPIAQKMEKEFKQLKKDEEANGQATFVENPYVIFITPKE